jgi:hypothetical protein
MTESRILGFTGSSKIITPAQEKGILEFVLEFNPLITHDGDCVIGDALFRKIVIENTYARVVSHPAFPVGHPARANMPADEVRPIPLPRPNRSVPLVRNDEIVAEIAHLLAAPSSADEVLRSGTWATVREAKRRGVPVTLILPSGQRVHLPKPTFRLIPGLVT